MSKLIAAPVATRATSRTSTTSPITNTDNAALSSLDRVNPKVIVAGAVAIDVSCDYYSFRQPSSPEPQLHTSNPASVSQTLGGVGFNIAKALHHLDIPVVFCSAVGNDLSGQAVLKQMAKDALLTDAISVVEGASTAHYIAVNDQNKDLFLAMADMRICESGLSELKTTWLEQLHKGTVAWAVLDANLNHDLLHDLADLARSHGAMTALEPVSVAKAERSIRASREEVKSELLWRFWPNHLFDLTAPNAMELAAMYRGVDEMGLFEQREWFRIIDALGIPSSGLTNAYKQLMPTELVEQGLPQQMIKMLPLTPLIITKLGASGVLVTQLLEQDDPRLGDDAAARYILGRGVNSAETPGKANHAVGGVYVRYFASSELVEEVVSVNGVGDTFLGTIIAGLAKHHGIRHVEDLIDAAQKAAVMTLNSKDSVSAEIKVLKDRL